MSSIDTLIAIIIDLSQVRIGQIDHGCVNNAAGLLLKLVLTEERWLSLFNKRQQEQLITISAKRIRTCYTTKIKNLNLRSKEAARECIEEEIAILEQTFELDSGLLELIKNLPKKDRKLFGL
jgi:hypothetical protein